MKHIYSALFISLLFACNDPVFVGSDLLGEDSLDVSFTDTLSLPASTVVGDSVLTFRKLSQDGYPITTMLVGAMDDPVYGRSKSSLYFTPTVGSTFPDLRELTIDSVVMAFSVEPEGFYGDINASHSFLLEQLAEPMDQQDTFYSNRSFLTTGEVLWEGERVVSQDSIFINPYTFDNPDTTIRIAAQLRFNLDKEYWLDLLETLPDSITDESFYDAVNGFKLSSEPSSSGMAGLNMSFNSVSASSFMTFYYRTDTSRLTYSLPLGRYRHSHFEHDYSGSEIEASLGDTESSKLYLQSMGGTNILLDISSIMSISDKILNFGQLEFTIKSPFDDDFPPVEAIAPWFRDVDGVLQRATASEVGLALEKYTAGERLYTYSIDITPFLSTVIRGDIEADELMLIAISKVERANQITLEGSSADNFAAKLKVILTNP